MSDQDLSPSESAILVLDEAENLIWALLDEQIDEPQSARLTSLLEQHEDVRRRYVECVQLHVDLQQHFAGRSAEVRPGTPILPNLMSSGLSGAESPVTE